MSRSIILILLIHFFYKNTFYKKIQARNGPVFKSLNYVDFLTSSFLKKSKRAQKKHHDSTICG